MHLLDAADLDFHSRVLMVFNRGDLQNCSGMVPVVDVEWRYIRGSILGIVVVKEGSRMMEIRWMKERRASS